jgi:hypothetical protein
LQQIVRGSAKVSEEVTKLYENNIEKGRRPPLVELTKVLQNEARRFSKVFILIDALDECTDNNDTRASFLAQIRALYPHIHLLVTSRADKNIEREFETAQRLEISANNEDLRTYVDSRIAKNLTLRRYITKYPGLQDAIIEKAKGMYVPRILHCAGRNICGFVD